MTRPERPTPPPLSRQQLARLSTDELLERVRMQRNLDPLLGETATRLEEADAEIGRLRAELEALRGRRGVAA